MPAPDNKSKSFTWKEVAKHNTRHDAWISIRGKVYNVTDWIRKHPGGEDVVLWSIGRDATQVFESYHENGSLVQQVLKKYEIGSLLDNELPVFPGQTKFQQMLNERVRKYFKDTRQDPKFHYMMLVRYLAVLTLIAVAYYLQFFDSLVSTSAVLSAIAAVGLGFGCAQIGLLPMHDASHCSFTHSPFVWRLLGSLHDFLNGASYLNWIYQHVLGHHPYTNVVNADPDISTNDQDIRRIKTSQEWLPRYVWQYLYAPVIYGLLGIKVRIQDVNVLFNVGSNDKIRVNPIETGWHFNIFWLGKAFFVVYRFLVPLLFSSVPSSRVFTLFVVSDLVSSYWLALTFQANHVVEDIEWPVPNDKNEMKQGWAEMQVVTAQDYSHGGFFWTNFAGALNYQVVHHLFPNISQHYYPEIAPIVLKTCKEFNIRYRVKKSWAEAIGGHLKWLKHLGVKTAP